MKPNQEIQEGMVELRVNSEMVNQSRREVDKVYRLSKEAKRWLCWGETDIKEGEDENGSRKLLSVC